jgi:prepilin-type N-terminal cleavage/methylation domain-containing protein
MQRSAIGVKTRSKSRRGATRIEQAGFTLIEILAVVLILGLLMGLLLPALGAGSSRSLRKQGDRVAATLELARQRAVVTGKPHRVVLDLEAGAFAVEWLVTDAEALGDEEDELALDETADDGLIDLSPPLANLRDYYPIPNRFGRAEVLDRGFFFEGIDTTEGWIESGEAYVFFAWDGSTDASQIVISDPDNRSIDLDVAPLLDVVRIHEEVD